MARPRLVLLGGFLGSGKTTLMLELGRRLRADGARVGVVTNDQGEMLVDTEFADATGLAAGEVQNGCFCCNFSAFVANLQSIIREIAPDYIIAEPVGSCTDLAATVLTPLTLYHDGLVDLAAYLVLADAPRLAGEYQRLSLTAPLTPREVLLSHQIREAGALLLSKTDAVSPEELARARKLLVSLSPDAPLMELSARRGDGMAALTGLITSGRTARIPRPVEIDYEVYAEAEAEMGWYNGHAELLASSPDAQPANGMDPEAIALDLALVLSQEFGSELIHGKLVVTTESGSIKVSVVSGVLQADVARDGTHLVSRAGLTLNLRATVAPGLLAARVMPTVRETIAGQAKVTNVQERALIPGAPVPEHRIL